MMNVIRHYPNNDYWYIPDDNFSLMILRSKGKNIAALRITKFKIQLDEQQGTANSINQEV